MKICLVTGSSGFIGSNLVENLLRQGNMVVALSKNIKKEDSIENIKYKQKGRYISISRDILDRDFVMELFPKYKFHEVYHLAGQSSPTLSWEKPAETMKINYSGTLNILDGALKENISTAIVLVSSSAVYSPHNQNSPIKENSECRPVSPYGISKLAMDQLGTLYAKAYGLRVTSARPFFIIGPGKINDVCSDWIRNIVLLERDELKSLSIGTINGIARDFLAVSDAVSALIKIVSNGEPGQAYNICSGEAIYLSSILEFLKKNAKNNFKIEVDEKKFRPIEEFIKVGDNRKLISLGWSKKENIETCMHNILKYWRSRYISNT